MGGGGGGGGVTYLNLGCRCRACVLQRFLNPDPFKERKCVKSHYFFYCSTESSTSTRVLADSIFCSFSCSFTHSIFIELAQMTPI